MVLIVGTQKAGTSWLWKTLSDCPLVRPGFTKEMHIFDALHVEVFKGYRRMIQGAAHAALRTSPVEAPEGRANALRRANFLYQPALYFDYFAALLQEQPVSVEATPTYMGLPISAWAEIKDQFASRGVRVAPIISLREPVNRLASDIRFKYRRERKAISDQELDQRLQVLSRDGINQYIRTCSDYRSAVERLRNVFGDDLLVLMYEEFFEAAETERLASFIGLDQISGDFGSRVNSNEIEYSPLEPGRYPGMVDLFRDQYGFARDLFGVDAVERYWVRS